MLSPYFGKSFKCVSSLILKLFTLYLIFAVKPISVLKFQRSLCVRVCRCVYMCVRACARSQCRALEAYGNCGLPTGLLGRVCASGSGASGSVSAAFIHSVRHSPYSSVRPRCEPGCSLRFSKKTRDEKQHGITFSKPSETRIPVSERTWSD